ncbi:putative Chitinase [Melia azedarach]|uniref:Chitinase n=1 Tax=Melia azedarach TaxID=155640 RepID=A0ACC1XDS7_MELAZ|nr:putative Chitinase [Melia azedarach]
MAFLNYVSLLSIFVCMTTVTGDHVTASLPAVKAAYWPSWAENFPPSAIDTKLFTHIYYAFLNPNNVTYKFDISNSTAVLLSDFTTSLHHKNPPVKTLFSIGGGGSDSSAFARMASHAQSRKAFIKSSIEVAREFGFDGLDLDWEFPKTPKEMQDLGHLFDEWRLAINAEAKATYRPPLLVTAAVYFSVDFFLDEVYRKYPVDSIHRNLDWINAMCFDYHGSWDNTTTGAHAALYDDKSNVSTSYGLKSWLLAGVPKTKLVMGLPLYGRSWKLKDPNIHGIGAPAVDVGPGVEGDKGVLPFSQVEEFNRVNGATVVYDVDSVSTYSYAGSAWIGYDDPTSTTVKIGFAQALGLRGYFFWAISFDSDWKISTQASRAWILND